MPLGSARGVLLFGLLAADTFCQSRGRPGALSHQADPRHRAVRAGRRHRHHHADDPARAVGAPRSATHYRQSRRGGRQYRHGGRCPRNAGRLHAVPRQCRHRRDQPEFLSRPQRGSPSAISSRCRWRQRRPGSSIANPKFPPNSLTEMVAYVKARARQDHYASSGISSPEHARDGAIPQGHAGLDMTQVPYKGGAGPALNDPRRRPCRR